ncbi:MAG: twin-arginine translocation signal domain-containing protein, partial [Actinobacteria bacterium]|nr:twin-arginine translocation signal domain-containing protein [Actinomycetota bacterium]
MADGQRFAAEVRRTSAVLARIAGQDLFGEALAHWILPHLPGRVNVPFQPIGRKVASMPSFRDDDSGGTPRGMDRRRFLQLLGVGGAGVAGALSLPSLAWAETMDAITLGDRINQLGVAYHGSSWNWAENCQAAQFWAERAAGLSDSQIQTYSTARAAYNASSIVSKTMSS